MLLRAKGLRAPTRLVALPHLALLAVAEPPVLWLLSTSTSGADLLLELPLLPPALKWLLLALHRLAPAAGAGVAEPTPGLSDGDGGAEPWRSMRHCRM